MAARGRILPARGRVYYYPLNAQTTNELQTTNETKNVYSESTHSTAAKKMFDSSKEEVESPLSEISDATPWHFSQDLGILHVNLGSWDFL